ncbi:outer membrane biogenesis protein [Elusimicrobium simillimum]|uniref:AsmA family protein n=1 Tax=Elusimicrobium simillimum TaxID=3143438 RepID=UPI003C6FE30E
MKKLIKVLIILFIVLLVLLLGAAFALRQIFNADKVREIVVDYAKTNYNREVRFDDVSFRLIGVELSNFAVSEKATFKDGTFAEAKSLVVKIALAPLFKKQIEVSTVGLEGFTANIIKDKNGVFNFADLIPAENEAPRSPRPRRKLPTKALPLT